MVAKRYLRSLERLDMLINQKMEELDGLKSTLHSIGGIDYSKEKVSSSVSGETSFQKTIERIVDLESEIDGEIDMFVSKKHEIINQIQALENTTYVQVLYKRYVEYKRLEMIAVEMDFTYQYIRRLHGEALQEFEKSYKKQHFSTSFNL